MTHLSSEDNLASYYFNGVQPADEQMQNSNIEGISDAALTSMAHLKPIRAAGTMPGDGYKKIRDRDNMSMN